MSEMKINNQDVEQIVPNKHKKTNVGEISS